MHLKCPSKWISFSVEDANISGGGKCAVIKKCNGLRSGNSDIANHLSMDIRFLKK